MLVVEETGAMRHDDGLGGSITILEHGSESAPMRFRMVMPRGMQPPAPECHPTQSEDFTVLRGTLDLGVVDGRHVVLHAGDTFHLPAGAYHLPANRTDDELEFEAVLTPGLEAADMFTDLYAVMREHRGLGQFARVAMVFRHYQRTITFKPLISLVMRIVAGVARAVKLRATKPRVAATSSEPQAEAAWSHAE